MPFPPAPRTKGGKGNISNNKQADSFAWAAATSVNTAGGGGGGGQHDEASPSWTPPAAAEEKAPFSSNGMTDRGSLFSSNNSGAAERMKALDMDPEAVSHVRSGVRA